MKPDVTTSFGQTVDTSAGDTLELNGEFRCSADTTDDRTVDADPLAADFHLLIVDDNKDFCYALFDFFDALGFDVSGTHEPQTALHLIRSNGGFDAVIVDLDMPGLSGLELLEEARAEQREFPALLVTGQRIHSQLVMRARAAGCVKIYSKPVDFAVLHEAIRHLQSPATQPR